MKKKIIILIILILLVVAYYRYHKEQQGLIEQNFDPQYVEGLSDVDSDGNVDDDEDTDGNNGDVEGSDNDSDNDSVNGNGSNNSDNGNTNGEVTVDPELAKYFQDKLYKTATDIMDAMPIEGFDVQLYLSVYKNMEQQDFDGVQAFEGVYEIQNGQAVFVRTKPQPVSSAQSTISDEGYVTLLKNISNRLELQVKTETGINTLIEVLK